MTQNRRFFFWLALLVCLNTAGVAPDLGLTVRVVLAQTSLPAHRPKVCTGYNLGASESATEEDSPSAAEGTWGNSYPAKTAQRICPDNHVFTSAVLNYTREDPSQNGSERRGIVNSNCCPLPAEDILTEEHSWANDQCPEGFVATGSCIRPETSACPNGTLRCTKVNTLRYQLAAETVGTFWGYSSRSAFRWREAKRVKHSDIPLGMRYGASRKARYALANAGCVGDPFGSILTSISGWRCIYTRFKQLQFRGVTGDPAPGTPVTVFPACDRLSDIYSADPQCILEFPVN